MNTHPSQQMTLLGLATMACYAVLLATGTVGIDVMPQFAVSAIIFLSSGRLMRQAARKLLGDALNLAQNNGLKEERKVLKKRLESIG